jgi:hypothetical protein
MQKMKGYITLQGLIWLLTRSWIQRRLIKRKKNWICYCISFIEIGQANDILWMHGILFFIFEGWKGVQNTLRVYSQLGYQKGMAYF